MKITAVRVFEVHGEMIGLFRIGVEMEIIRVHMGPLIDGIECWHSAHDPQSAAAYSDFAQAEGLLRTGGSDCHQQPLIMGTVDVPDVAMEALGTHNF